MRNDIRSFDYDDFEGWHKTAYMMLSTLGFFGYMVLSLISAALLALLGGILWFWLHNEKKDYKRDPLAWLVYCFDRYILRPLWRIAAGIMGWGSRTARPWMMPFFILGSIPAKVKPNKVCLLLGIPTGLFVGLFLLALLIDPTV